MAWQDEGREPDYRFSLANERTYLAWMRTALALLAAAVLFHQFATHIQPKWVLALLSGFGAIAAGGLALGGFMHWRKNQIAMRHEQPLPRSALLAGLALVMVALCVATAIVLVLQ